MKVSWIEVNMLCEHSCACQIDIVLTKNIDFFFTMQHGDTFPLTWKNWWLQV